MQVLEDLNENLRHLTGPLFSDACGLSSLLEPSLTFCWQKTIPLNLKYHEMHAQFLEALRKNT